MPNTITSIGLPSWRSQAPANTMILGEHSVVYGHPALACAVDQYISIDWQAREDNALHIYSALGEHHTQLEVITAHPKLNFVISALQAFQKELPHGFDMHIESEFSSTIGLGSSAAVLAAMLSGLNTICKTNYSLIQLFEIGHKIILDIQGRGSATDLAASLAGGVIFFQPKSAQHSVPQIKNLAISLPLVLIYCGYKTPTSEVLEKVAKEWQNKPSELEMLYRSMAKITRMGFEALQNNELHRFYQACEDYQQSMQMLGVNDKVLQTIIDALYGCESIAAAKISGSGLGDCVLGIGTLNQCLNEAKNTLNRYQQMHINISPTGANTVLLERL